MQQDLRNMNFLKGTVCTSLWILIWKHKTSRNAQSTTVLLHGGIFKYFQEGLKWTYPLYYGVYEKVFLNVWIEDSEIILFKFHQICKHFRLIRLKRFIVQMVRCQMWNYVAIWPHGSQQYFLTLSCRVDVTLSCISR